MGAGGKANNVAASNGESPVFLSYGAEFIDGTPLGRSNPASGGIVRDGSDLYSLATTAMVPGGQATTFAEEGYAVPKNRAGKISIKDADRPSPPRYGSELEAVWLNEEGYVALPWEEQMLVRELYSFMDESGTKATADQQAFEQAYWDMIHGMVGRAHKAGAYVASLSVFGQHDPRWTVNQHPYVAHVVDLMGSRTGFDTVQTFRVGGAQSHTELSDTKAGLLVAEAMQPLNPILMSPTLAGPFVTGGSAGSLANQSYSEAQRAHMYRAGIAPEDLSARYHSYRYLLRSLGSPAAGIWRDTSPDSVDTYLKEAHQMLANGEINSIDRFFGSHTDRLRSVLDGSGAITFESCSNDTALGNPDVLVPLQLLQAGIVTSLEAAALDNKDPREIVAKMLGTTARDGRERLQLAHKLSLRVAREGNDAHIYGRRRVGAWLPDLIQLADSAPHTTLTDHDKARLRRMFEPSAVALEALHTWCSQHSKRPSVEAYFDLGIGSPSVYMIEQYDDLRGGMDGPRNDPRIVAQIELAAGKALHDASMRKQEQRQYVGAV